MYSFIEYICYELKDINVNNLTVIEIVINTMFTYPWKNDQKAHGWQFIAEVNNPFSCQFSQTGAHTHQSVSWDLK